MTKEELIKTGVATAGAVATGLAARGRRPLSELEQKYGKRPLFGKKRREWEERVRIGESGKQVTTQQQQQQGSNNKTIYIVGGLLVAGLIVYLVIRSNKNN